MVGDNLAMLKLRVLRVFTTRLCNDKNNEFGDPKSIIIMENCFIIFTHY